MVFRIFLVTILVSFAPALSAQDEMQTRQLLQERNKEFEQDVIRVSDSVYTAVGFGLSPVSMIVGDTGILIIDTNLDLASGKAVMVEFGKITDLPVKAIIFTHGHGDHTGGVRAFVDDDTKIWARAPFNIEDKQFAEAGLKTIYQTRGFRQFGVLVPEDDIEHVGITPRYFPAPDPSSSAASKPVNPTHTFSGTNATLDVAGLKLELVAASGETGDQLFVWFEKERTVFAGDNFYKSWPNLYAIRGTTYRDVYAWINSLTAMLEKEPHNLVGGHTRPVLGEAQVTDVLTNYRDAVKYVFDKTVEGMEKGLTPDELVSYAKLPEKYQKLDYLRPYYGHPDWGVRSIFTGYLGWFDGNPTNLFPLPPKEQAAQMVQLAGGAQAVQDAMTRAKEAGQYQWALQLSDYLLQLSPNDRNLLLRKADLLDARAQQVLNVTARNYYRSYAFELRKRAEAREKIVPSGD